MSMIIPALALLLQAADIPAETPAPVPPAAPYALPGEEAVAPYTASNAHAQAMPFEGSGMLDAFHGKPGIQRVVDRFVALNFDDPVNAEIFKSHDKVRLSRVLFEQFCYILNGGCDYSGRDMKSAHKDLGIQQGDMNRAVELLQKAMTEEKIGFAAQNRFLSKLAPMRHDIVER